LKSGDSKTVVHAYPADFADDTLAGETVNIEATIKTVRAVTLPALDDEFAKTAGKYESLDALRDVLSKDIEARARADYDDEYFAQLVDKIKEDATIKYAQQSLNHEAEHVVDDLRQRLAQQGLDLETYYKMRNTEAAKFFEEEAKPVAKKRLERSLILDEISRQEKIEVDNESLDQEFNNTLVDMQMQGVNINKIRGGKQGQQRVAEAVAMESANRLLTRRTLDTLKSIATGEYKPETSIPDENEEKTEEAVNVPASGDVQDSKASEDAAVPSDESMGKAKKSAASKKSSAVGKSKSTSKKSTIKK
jgi:trigger factor